MLLSISNRSKALRGNDLGRARPAPSDVTPLVVTTYNYFIYFKKINGISGLQG